MEALCGTVVEVPTLDGRILSVPVTQACRLPNSELQQTAVCMPLRTRRMPSTLSVSGCMPITQVVAPGVTKVVPGEGMPTVAGASGDLILLFDTEFPKTLTPEQKGTVKRALK